MIDPPWVDGPSHWGDPEYEKEMAMTEMTDFPEKLRLRDTKLRDDLGGAGQRIFTTAGQGYKKVEYIRGDLVEDLLAAVNARNDLLNECINELEQIARGRHLTGDKIDRKLYTRGFANRLNEKIAALD